MINNDPDFPLKKEDKKTYITLTDSQLEKKIEFINKYTNAVNAADGSPMDANSNVSNKNIHTMEYEINKDIMTQVNRRLVTNKLKELFDDQIADDYLKMLEDHVIYTHDETSLKPYCVSITMYPFLINGLKDLDINGSSAPQHLSSYCGGFINLMLAIASQFAGAVATAEFLMYYDYFARKDYGDNYLETHLSEIEGGFSQVVYSINQPAVSRGFQSIFWNISIYDREYFNSIFGEFCFPDGSKPNYNSLFKLQKTFMKWFNKERTKALLTYPVITAACLNQGDSLKDKDFEEFISEELSEGNSFFVYTSEDASALSSCCFEGDEIIEVECNNVKQNLPIKTFVNLVNEGVIKLNEQEILISSWNPIKNIYEKARVTGVLRKRRPSIKTKSGRMYRVSTGGSSIIITGDHIVPVRNYQDKIETRNIEYYYNVIKEFREDSKNSKNSKKTKTKYKVPPSYKVLTLDGWKECSIELV